MSVLGTMAAVGAAGGLAKAGYDWLTKEERQRQEAASRGSQADRSAAGLSAQDRKNALRDAAVGGVESRVSAAQGALARHQDSSVDRQRSVRAGAAKGFASTAPGMGYGGAGVAAAAQAGMDAEMLGIQQAAADEERAFGLEGMINDARVAAAEYKMGAGSATDDYNIAVSDAEKYINAEIRESQGLFDDDETRMHAAVQKAISEARANGNEKAAQYLESKWLKGGSLAHEGYDKIESWWD